MSMKFDMYGIGMLLIVVLVIGLFFLYLIVPQAEKIVDVPLVEDRDESPSDQVQEDIKTIKKPFLDLWPLWIVGLLGG